ncbi:hypothetical protein [Aureimonas sp. AU40]|uniref:hypothetical protein n=1 Tax=Aureimonas sp. AU40 TaxID=1637747 RepID=UPI0007813EBE|nr:hypothetical protein [Aureimonas sp. AU40]
MKKIRDVQTVIGLLEDGQLAQDFSDLLQKTLADLKELAGPKGKAKGSVTLKMDLTAEGGTVTINSDIAAKTPKSGRAASVLFVLDDGSLSTEHPRQMSMFGGPRDIDGERRRAGDEA